MVFAESSDDARVFALAFDSVDGGGEVGDAAAGALEGGDEGEVGAVVQHAGHVVLIRADPGRVVEVDFADHVDACGGVEAGPEAFVYFEDGVEAEAVDGVVGDEFLDPGLVA